MEPTIKTHTRGGYHFCTHFHFGNVVVSAGASDSHYCRPRENRSSLEEFTHVELAFFLDGAMVEASRIKGIGVSVPSDGCESPVYANVPIAELRSILETLSNR